MREFIELLSIGASDPTIGLSFAIAFIFLPLAWQVWKEKPLAEFDETDCWISGVGLGFLGSALDNLYWSIAWHSHYLDWSTTSVLFDYGAVSNIIARQSLGLIAGVFHLRAIRVSEVGWWRRVNIAFAAMWLFSFAHMAILVAIKYG